MEPTIVLNIQSEQRCTECGKCFAVCPARAIVRSAHAYRIDPEKCTRCGVCLSACNYGAIVRSGEE